MSVRGFARLTFGAPATDYGQGFMSIRATTTQGNGVALLTINAALGALLRPRGETEQRLMVRVIAQLPSGPKTLWMGGINAWSHEETAQHGGRWSLTLPAHAETLQGAIDHGFLGWAGDYENAPPPGTGNVRLELLYDLPDGTLVPVVLFNGFSVSSSRTEDPQAGHRLELTGGGGEVAHDRAVGELDLPPNHGKTPGEIATLLLIAGGMPASQIKIGSDVGPPRNNPFSHPCAETWAAAVECLRQGARHDLYMDRDGFARSRPSQGGI